MQIIYEDLSRRLVHKLSCSRVQAPFRREFRSPAASHGLCRWYTISESYHHNITQHNTTYYIIHIRSAAGIEIVLPDLLRASADLCGNELLQVSNGVVLIALDSYLFTDTIVTDYLDHISLPF